MVLVQFLEYANVVRMDMSTNNCKYTEGCYMSTSEFHCERDYEKCSARKDYENYGKTELGFGAPMISPLKNLEDKVND